MAQPQVALAFEDGVTRFIEIEEDQTITDAAYKARINIPFDCRDGACGTCKAFCESGEYEEGDYIDDALTEDEADEGYILCCQTYPIDDMVVNIATTSAAAKTGAGTMIGHIVELEQLSKSTIKFAVHIEDRDQLYYLPGQYMNIAPPNADFHRSYSFSSGPSDDIVTFLVKNTPGGKMSTYLTEEAKVGDRLNLTGPMGSFFLREPFSPILLLAGGTGLAPILAILEKLAEDPDLTQPVRLIYGATFNHDIVEVDRLNQYKDILADFDWFSVVSGEGEEHDRTGYVTDHIAEEYLHGGDVDVYLCGPPAMVEAVRTFFRDLDAPPQNFYYEKFTPNVPATSDTPEDSRIDEAPATDVTQATTVASVEDGLSKTITSQGDVETGHILTAKTDSEAQFNALMALELGVITLMIDQLDEEDYAEMRQLAQACKEFISDTKFLDATGYTAANAQYHNYLFDRSGNDAMKQAYNVLDVVEVMNEVLDDEGFVVDGIEQDHFELVDALEAKDFQACRAIVEKHHRSAIATVHRAIEEGDK
ncbi:benzoate 1,2-dioxygenase electron transfer component BenC [Corynebacterium cystitidis]|uniref:Benzoate/toluate 1,2-dioxygenase reductase subunit n=1 Tax=Corynebacterium cystitidis DSM 20524 TaxID=1121357 RepID=A0A1H9SSC1_9CORY|nr:benzoate 1,2-dioxygenase electron transfer component BenC [Corynebacterium cystitidis]WJY83139.1 Benzoate 1,2-dioxygenase electron transfer component [Corynebacterium cystitidis DSM 20524]SER87229.1 benzoate/toluate 1,2-dioxygenase reductase subunit [Corynebacterium cystitidis DSM 20524]SNV66685.1 benzoate 1,2-dioxygenase ferredoxin reductase subunit [Corynebacterium cystitidis]